MRKPYHAAIVVLTAAVSQSSCSIEWFGYEMIPTLITVLRASDGASVSGVLVRVRYNYNSMMFTVKLNSPSRAEGTTNDSGAVVLPIADFRNGLVIHVGERPTAPYFGVSSLLLWRDQIRSGGEFKATSFLIDGERSPELRIIVQRPAPALLAEQAETLQ